MTRLIATMLALSTGLCAEKSPAQDVFGISMANTAEGGLSEIMGTVVRFAAFAATELGITDLVDCPQLGGREGEDLMIDPETVATRNEFYRPNPCGDGLVYGALCNNELAVDTDLADGVDGNGVNVPKLGGQEDEDVINLWFELVDAGYTEDEAFDLVELVMFSPSSLSDFESGNTQ